MVLLAAQILLMLSLAFLFTPAFSTSLGSLPPQLYSYGSATISTVQQLAAAGGTAVFVALYSIGIGMGIGIGTVGGAGVPSAAQASAGSHLAFLAGTGLSLVVLVLDVVRPFLDAA